MARWLEGICWGLDQDEQRLEKPAFGEGWIVVEHLIPELDASDEDDGDDGKTEECEDDLVQDIPPGMFGADC
jgi:hypothetical protein